MSIGHEPSALANFGISQWPQGTLEETQAAGYDTKVTATCSAGENGNRPCPVAKTCQFHLKSMGGFKFKSGPRYIAFRELDPAEPQAAGQDVMKCYTWVMSKQGAANENAALRRRTGGRHGAIIRVIAQEGEEYLWRGQVPINGKGEVIHPMPEMIPFSPLPMEQAVTYRMLELKRKVPKHPRPGEPQGDAWVHKIAMLDAEQEAQDREYVDYGMHAPATSPPESEAPKGRNWAGIKESKDEG